MSDGKKPEVNANLIEQLLKKLAMGEELTEKQRKDMKDYKFWKTQPVAKFDEMIDHEGPIDKPKTTADIPDTPYPMLKEFEWVTMDLEQREQLSEVHEFLHANYVEDKDSTFRFAYSPEFFEWALKPPGWKKEWHVGVRVKSSKKLVAFISAIPAKLRVRSKELQTVEINFLVVHKQLRNKRLAPVLIKEITRRVNKHDIWQALYTAGVVLPSPVTTCRYTHRPLNWPKLYDIGFSGLRPGETKASTVAKYTIGSTTKVAGLRPMKVEDVDEVFELFEKYHERFDIVQKFTKPEFIHWMLGDAQQQKLAIKDKIIVSYVVENPETHKITDFLSFYILPFTVLEDTKYDSLNAAYLFYYATDADFGKGDRFSKEATAALTKRLESLVSDGLVLAKNMDMDVFNALTSQDNVLFLNDLKFGLGDGFLNLYLFNYMTFPIKGGLQEDNEFDLVNRSGVGVVML
ncbi:unnamed protein product [Ambrosiozyma monospora]|uniref:Glycylpeptide N-tetradecanoyltransferase n=1 Tax=Ambrosiozyma monospora TaxID=43982 RepID=A0A9W6YL54_AMBMO|nr:unnamed protein product [Ambrosiozyma monospora]